MPIVVALSLGCSLAVLAGQNAAPSSHLVFDDNFEGDILINEVRVPKDGEALYTYYETLGWRGRAAGYAGIQSHPRGHNYIFSIWDHKSHTLSIKALHRGPGTETQKFGGEGTGLKSWNFELGWESGTWYTLVSRCWPVGNHTFYGFWARSGKTKQWTHLVTMNVAAKDAYFQGSTDAFIEDWLETGAHIRTTNIRGGWKRRSDGHWHAFGGGRYSVNYWDLEPGKRSYNFRTNWNGGVAKDANGEFYFMTAGGKKTKPSIANPSRHTIKRTSIKPNFKPIKIKSAKASLTESGKLVVTWENDATTLPQFSYRVEVHDSSTASVEPIASAQAATPNARKVGFSIPSKLSKGRLLIHLKCHDILDNPSPVQTVGIGG